MKIKSAEFILSATSPEHYPNEGQPEILLSGRSNVGKSSFINSMLNRKSIARVSSKPGKTQTLNFFHVNKSFYFVDVPGYGYAKVPKPLRKAFGEMIEKYIHNRKTLKAVILLVDFRHKPTEDDVIMYNFLKYFEIPMIVVATKLDKVKRSQHGKQEKLIKQTLNFDKENDLFVAYSSETKAGKEKAWQAIGQFLDQELIEEETNMSNMPEIPEDAYDDEEQTLYADEVAVEESDIELLQADEAYVL